MSLAVAGVIILVFALVLLSVSSGKKKKKPVKKERKRSTVIRDATKKLAQNPHHVPALTELSALYFGERNWEKALPLYMDLLNIASNDKSVDMYKVALRKGICALHLKKHDEAMDGLITAAKIDGKNFECNYYLGQAYFENDNFDKAIPFLRRALSFNQETETLYRWLGIAYYKTKKFRDSLPYLRRALESKPEDQELLYSLAEAMRQTGYGDKALKVFMHLRPNPEYGALSCLAAGVIHMGYGDMEKAEQDFEIGIKHSNVPPELMIEIKYRYGLCLLQGGKLDKGLSMLQEVQMMNHAYRDVSSLITRYTELKQNRNLQIYLTAGNSDFVALCRKLVESFYEKATVRIMDITVSAEYTEILAELDTAKWEDLLIFRFYRTSGTVGELFIRDFHGRIRDVRAGRGICVTAGTYSDEAKKYIEGRPIDLVDKTELIKRLKKIDSYI